MASYIRHVPYRENSPQENTHKILDIVSAYSMRMVLSCSLLTTNMVTVSLPVTRTRIVWSAVLLFARTAGPPQLRQQMN